MLRNPVKDKLARGELVASMTVRLVPGVEIVRIAKSAGFDTLYIDLEHSSFSIATASQISIMALEAGLPAFAAAGVRRVPRLRARVRALIAAIPGRVIWGSDYPHLSFADRVDSKQLFRLLQEWAPDSAVRERILQDNPRRCFGF